jgi:hypothetical protein
LKKDSMAGDADTTWDNAWSLHDEHTSCRRDALHASSAVEISERADARWPGLKLISALWHTLKR